MSIKSDLEILPITVFARMRYGHDAQNHELIDSLLVGVYLMGSETAIAVLGSVRYSFSQLQPPRLLSAQIHS
jgi:hypothetical protein